MDLDRTIPSPRPAPRTLARDAYRQPTIVARTLGLLLIAFTVTGSPALSADPQPGVRIAGAVYLGDLPTRIAETRGFFADQGIDARVEYLPSGARTLERLRGGAADFALMPLTPIVLDRLADPTPGGGDDPVIIAGLAHSTNLLALVASAERGIRSPADLRGHRLAINRGTNTEFVWWLLAQYHGLEPDSVTLVDRPFPEMAAGLRRGEFDAAILWEPWAARAAHDAREQEDVDLHHFDLRHIYAGKWVLVTTRATVEERTALCSAVLTAYRDAIEFIEREPEAALRTRWRDAGDTTSFLRERWSGLDYDLNLDWTLVAALQEQFHWARVTGQRNAGRPVRVFDVIAAEPLRARSPGRVGIPPPVEAGDTSP